MPTKRSPFALAIVALLSLAAGAAQGAVPNAATSFVDPCLRICPGGDIGIHIVVRDAANNPVAVSTVVLDLCSGPSPEMCNGLVLCPPGPNDGYTVNGCHVIAITNAAGVVDFKIRGGGTCQDSISVFADGVLLAIRNSIASPDQNGDLTVNAVDNGILGLKLGTPDPTGDLNCSGLVEIGDPDALVAHSGHTCQAVVPVVPKSWGTVKVIYR